MKNSIISRADSVQFVYGKYLKEQYIVNRKYQRKLVWTLQEKQAFIDSLIQNYSVPLFLFAIERNGGSEKWEIIDGLQRMNAICSFIENEFPIYIDGKTYYFDLDTLADSLQLKTEGKLQQNYPILNRQICTEIVNYQLPISIIQADSKSVETVFRRINSFGRQLSEQEIRLAGAVGRFPDLVRRVSSIFRGDVSEFDKLTLNAMATISISAHKLRYGIQLKDIFWIQNEIITKGNIRKSRDEELVSHLLAYILLGDDICPSKRTLDKLYQYEESSDLFDKINDSINKIGYDELESRMLEVHETLKLVAYEAKTSLRSLLYKDKKPESLFRSFQILFLSIYDLKFKDGFRVVKEKELVDLLDGLGKSEFNNIGNSSDWNEKIRNKKIDAVKGVIRKAFSKSNSQNIGVHIGIQYIDNLLTMARTEGNQYDFKQTCHNLNSGQFSTELVEKIVKTLVAGANKPESVAYVILGIADKLESAKKYVMQYETTYKEVSNRAFFITGVEGEVNKYHDGKLDTYIDRIKSVIKSGLVERDVEIQILQNISPVSYYGHDIIIFKLSSGKEPYAFKDSYWIREGNNCKELQGIKDIKALQKQFDEIKGSGPDL